MSKAEINKEIVLLRKNVEQAKVCVIKKRTREITKLKKSATNSKSKSTDAEKEKKQRKADRIIAEILSIKKLKNDEITKHILTHSLNLKEGLNNKETDSLTRMIARIANDKIFSKKITDFKEKYPKYMDFLGPGRKKKAIMEWKEKRKLKKKGIDAEEADSDKPSENEESEESNEEGSSEDEDESESESSNKSNINNSLQLSEESREEESPKEKVLANDVELTIEIAKEATLDSPTTETSEIIKQEKCQKRKKSISETSEVVASSKKLKKRKKTDIPKVISKQAVVKKFTEILEENESNVDKEEIDNEQTEPSIQIEKEEDPFFVTGDGHSNYLSVAPIKSKSDNERNDYEDENNYRGNRFNNKTFSRQDSDKYFSNVSKFKNSNFKQANARWDGPTRNGKAYDKEKPGRNANFSKFNDGQRDKSKPFSRQSKGAIESASNEILHPSWEAKKKQQEALKKGFQGKKIVFGDDDV